MSDTLANIDAAITEVNAARQALLRRKTKQVSAADEIDRLKSVAYTWFQTHRPFVCAHSTCPDLTAVDAAYRALMQATGGHAARKTYADALRDAKQSLVTARTLVATTLSTTPRPKPATGTADTPPNFAPLAVDPRMQTILNRRWGEVQQCIGASAHLAATVMMGGLLESLLLARISSSPNMSAVFTAGRAPHDKAGKTLPLSEWKLVNMVEVAHELRWITKSAKDVGNVLRDFRNYIHPHKEYTDDLAISEEDAVMFWEVTKAVTRQVLGSCGKSP
ncbi:MAG: hypothetical protein NTY23_05525 [Chloroflexi bacterium]|nr:hypothetical protein [Chloroflexota bacterium]